MVKFHNTAGSAPVANWQSFADGDMIAFSRGAAGFLAINRADRDIDQLVYTGLPAGMYTDIIGGGALSVESAGQAQLQIDGLTALALLKSDCTL